MGNIVKTGSDSNTVYGNGMNGGMAINLFDFYAPPGTQELGDPTASVSRNPEITNLQAAHFARRGSEEEVEVDSPPVSIDELSDDEDPNPEETAHLKKLAQCTQEQAETSHHRRRSTILFSDEND